MNKKFIRTFIFCFVFLFLFQITSGITTNILVKAASNENVKLNSLAKSMVVIETTNNTVLYSKNENLKLPMASTTKIVTALTVIENCEDLDKIVTIPTNATNVEGSSIYLKKDEKYTIKELLYGLMLQSGNDAAMALALEIGNGSIENFAQLMNDTAKNCGVENSNFVTPHGLDAKDHYTTANDLAIITSKALKNSVFKEIVSSKIYKLETNEFRKGRVFINKNKLLSSLEGCIGVKTGYTSKAGRCLVSACERDGMQVVCVVLNCRPMFEESLELINKAFSEYKKYDILPSYKFVTDVSVEDGKSSSLRLYNKKGFSVVSTEKDIDKYSVIYSYSKNVKAPIKKDEVLGRVEIYFDKTLIFSEDLCSIEKVDSIDTNDKIKNILDKW